MNVGDVFDRMDLEAGLVHYSRSGRKISFRQWGRLSTWGGVGRGYKRVAATQVGPYWVSTVWIGIDLGLSLQPDRPPHIFETMVFGDTENLAHDLDCHRWATDAQARAGHDEIVTLIRATT